MKREIYPTKITQLVNEDREEASFLQETFLKFDEGIFRFGIAPRKKLYALAGRLSRQLALTRETYEKV